MKKGDFIKINYTGIAEEKVFDTTDPKKAEEAGLKGEFKPVTVCLGEGHLIKGLEDELIRKDLGKHTIKLPPEKAFGKKSGKLLQLIPLRQLKKEGINPVRGMELNIDGKYGIIRSVSGGRVIVDFNHPLSGKDITYEVEIIEVIKEPQKQVEALISMSGLPYKSVKVEGYHAIIKMKNIIPTEITNIIQERIKKLTNIRTVSFEIGDKPEKEEAK